MDNLFKFVKSFKASNRPGELHSGAKIAASRFDEKELNLLQLTWRDLADRANGKGIDKETFLQYFPLNGLLGERLFVQFDSKKTGFIDFDDFITGLSQVCRGSNDDKIRFVFSMYDITHSDYVSKQELAALLNHIPKYVLQKYDMVHNGDHDLESSAVSSSADEHHSASKHRDDDLDEVDQWTNHDMIEKAFEECDINHTGRLSYEEFKMWVEKNPAVMDYIESILPYNGTREQTTTKFSKTDVLPKPITRNPSIANVSESNSLASGRNLSSRGARVMSNASRDHVEHSGYMSPPSRAPSPGIIGGGELSRSSSDADYSTESGRDYSHSVDEGVDAEEHVRELLLQALSMTKNDKLKATLRDAVDTYYSNQKPVPPIEMPLSNFILKQGYLWKKGNKLHMWSKRFYMISGNCVYYYASKDDVRPKGVIFLTGCLVGKLVDNDLAMKGYFGFELLHQDMCVSIEHEKHKHEQRLLFCNTEKDRDDWVTLLQRAAAVVPIEDDYVLGKELGKGRFSVVRECVHKRTNVHCAVKIIEKASIEPEEKALLRTEIAVLKLVNHPNIIKLEGLYENKHNIYIVMEKLSGGELFERIVGRPRFSDAEAAKLIKPLLESVAYLHDLGIVHRDLKPENILCGDNLEDLKIADFGLSKMTLPKEKMDAACGTLSYVAPEVLTMAGYGKEADLWSVGVIMFLLMCGKLPFDGNDQNEIIKNTIQAELKVNQNVWGKMTEESKSLIHSLLARNPKSRISARDALKHPFILKFYPSKKASMAHLDLSPSRDKLAESVNLTSNSASPSPDPVATFAAQIAEPTSPAQVNDSLPAKVEESMPIKEALPSIESESPISDITSYNGASSPVSEVSTPSPQRLTEDVLIEGVVPTFREV